MKEALTLAVYLQVVREHAVRALDDTYHALRVVNLVNLRPVVWLRFDFVREQSACDYAVRETLAGISCNDVRVLGARVAADESHVVKRIENLTGPGVVDATSGSVALACPGLDFGEAA